VFLAEPARYFAAVQPRGGLFQESFAALPLRSGWVLLGIWVLLGLVAGGWNVHAALRKGLPPARWFAVGLGLNLVGVAWMMCCRRRAAVELPAHLQKVPLTAEPAKCPSCGHPNHPAARSCAGCGTALTPPGTSEVDRAGLRGQP
jgi:hypothetical protein